MTNEFEEMYGFQDPNDTRWLWSADSILYLSYGVEFDATLVESREPPRYHLAWTDHVANDWIEHYDYLPAAIMRLGALVDAVDKDRTFTQAAEEFAIAASAFLKETSA